MKYTKFLFIFFTLTSFLQLNGQKYLQIEKYGSPYTQKISIGTPIEYKLQDEDFYSIREIQDLDIENGLIVFSDRYLDPERIAFMRSQRAWPKTIGTSLLFFGVGWSTFAAIGTATDDDPNTSYRWSDAIVTGTSISLGLILGHVFKFKTIKFGKRNRLRILDISFDTK